MAPLVFTQTDNLAPIEWFTTFAFLGALCCAVVGIKLKWFRAQLTLDSVNTDESSVQARDGVYRPYASDIYSPSYREINETGTQVTHRQEVIDKKVVIPSKPSGNTTNSTRPKSTADSAIQSTSTVNGEVKNDKKSQKVKSDGTTSKDGIDKPKRSEKERKARREERAKREKEKKLKEEKRLKKEKEESLKREKEEKLKNEKEEKLKAKEEKLKVKEEKLKEKENSKPEKEKKDKDKKGKKTSKPVASVTIDSEAVASTQSAKGNQSTPLKTPPAYSKEPPAINPTSRVKNTRTNTTSDDIEPDGGFTSSWDMVAAHRQNLQREIKAPANNNLRSMANQSSVQTMARNNNLTKTSNNNMTRRFSDASKNSHESVDTEA